MQPALRLLSELSDADTDWIFETGTEQQTIANALIVREGESLDRLWIVLEGLCNVKISAFGDRPVGILGPGEIIGDVSFLEGRPASASVFALESSLLLMLPRSALEDKLRVDLEFAARFYRSLAVLNSKRLRERVTPLGLSSRDGAQAASAATTVGKALPAAIEEAKQFLVQADAEALKNDNVVPASMADRIGVSFRDLLVLANAAIGDASTETDAFKSELGARLRLEFLPYVLLTQTAERFYSKPRGYAGDFFTIEMIYQNRPTGTGRLGALFDECFLKTPPAKAVQNRRGLLRDEILRVVHEQGASARVTSLACGPAEEIFDTFAQLPDRNALKATLIDIDLQALAFVADKRDKAKLQNHIELVNGNLVYIAMGRQKMELKEQDLIYSIGLIDYFNDKFVIKLLNWIHGHLRPGGKVILGNFHPNNTSKAFMDYVLDWKLIHRTEEDMNRLFESSAFQSPCTAIRFEAEGVNLFAEGSKAELKP